MGLQDKPSRALPRERQDSLDYKTFLERSKSGKSSFDAFVHELAHTMQTYDGIDPYQRSALRPITEKADAFLRRRAGISYEEFLRQSKPENFIGNDYGKLPPKKNLKRRLFQHRSMLFLASLEDCDRKGYDIDSILADVRQGTIPYLKPEPDEPTFLEILRVLERRRGEGNARPRERIT